MNDLVSIIVPIYNAEKYIAQCIESVFRQSYAQWELLLINDGSTDGSSRICEELSLSDRRIRFIQKKNSGVSDSRNVGLSLALGTYIMFLDADDYWVNPRIIETFVSLAQKYNLDILKGRYIEFSDNSLINTNVISLHQDLQSLTYDSSEFLKKTLHGEYFTWQCIFKRTFIGNIRFDIDRVFLEDAIFYLLVLSKNGIFGEIDNCFYAYRKHPDAVSVKYVPQKMKDAFDFSRFCFLQADNGDGQYMYRKFCAEEGVQNYLFDISVISDKVCENKSLPECKSLYDLTNLRSEVVFKVREYKLYKYLLACLPLPLLVRYYNWKHKLRLLIKGA